MQIKRCADCSMNLEGLKTLYVWHFVFSVSILSIRVRDIILLFIGLLRKLKFAFIQWKSNFLDKISWQKRKKENTKHQPLNKCCVYNALGWSTPVNLYIEHFQSESEEWSSQWIFQFKQLERRSLKKKIRASTGFELVTSAIPVRCSTNWAMKPHIGSEVNLLSLYLPVRSEMM